MIANIPVLSNQNPISSIIRPLEEKPPSAGQNQSKPDYIIKENDSLTSIAGAQGTTVERLWRDNPQLADPNLLTISDPLKIPLDSDTLPTRDMPASQLREPTAISLPNNANNGRLFDTTGGWCTNYAARRHPVPSWFQNADMWLADARQAGMATGSTPQVGAIAQARSYMHVAIVEQVDGNRVYVSEQNYNAFGVVDYRWTDASEWAGYIY